MKTVDCNILVSQIAGDHTVTEWLPLIAAVIALVGVGMTVCIQTRNFNRQLKSAHALKIAEMRQAWINNVREAMAVFQSYGINPETDKLKNREFCEAGTRIKLLMNPDDPDYAELISTIDKFDYKDGRTEIYTQFMIDPKYISVCQKILKREWEVLKKEVAVAALPRPATSLDKRTK